MSVATFIAGIICEAIGVYMIYETATVTLGAATYSPAPLLLIIGAIFIVVAMATSSKSGPSQNFRASRWSRIWPVLVGIIILSIIFSMHYDPTDKDKYELLVDLIIIVVGIIAAVGYGIYKWISRNISERVDRIAGAYRNFTTAEVQTTLGFAWWQHFLDDKKKKQNIPDDYSMVYLKRAIENAERAITHANKLDKAEYEEIICRCESNLAYYLTERHRIENHPKDKERCLELAQHAYRVAQKKGALQSVRQYQWIETYAWVLWHFTEDNKTKQKAQTIIDELLERTGTPEDWSNDIDKKWKDLETKDPPPESKH